MSMDVITYLYICLCILDQSGCIVISLTNNSENNTVFTESKFEFYYKLKRRLLSKDFWFS